VKKELGRAPDPSEITPEPVYQRRREFIKNSLLLAATAAGVGGGLLKLMGGGRADLDLSTLTGEEGSALAPMTVASRSPFSTDEPMNSFRDITTYNNFYEFGLDKSDPARNAHTLMPRPWSVTIEGEVEKPQVVDIDTLLGWFPLEERVYRLRCVEAWSMVIPWIGFPLRSLLERVEPTPRAKYVAFTTLLDPTQMPNQRSRVLHWPYVEGLRLDEAMNPLTILAVGLYGRVLPNQDGAPLRLIVPWKYGFKGIKSIVRIRLTETQPPCTWNLTAPHEYGFYANVNPEVDHPRWSQAAERRIGEISRRPTLLFNGYADQVASLYEGMDLRVNF